MGNKYESPSALNHLSRLQSAYNVVGDGLLADNYGRRKYAADSIDLEAIDLDSGDGEGMHSRLDRSMAAEPHLWMALEETPERRFRSHEVYEDFPEIDIQDEDFGQAKYRMVNPSCLILPSIQLVGYAASFCSRSKLYKMHKHRCSS